jgi:hypothetical protein
MDAQGETKSTCAFVQRKLHSYQDINEDEFMVSEQIFISTTLFSLRNKLSRARASIIATMDAIHNVLATTSTPFTQLSTMLIHHQSHTTFRCHHHQSQRRGMHNPMALSCIVEAIVEEALAARADRSQRS